MTGQRRAKVAESPRTAQNVDYIADYVEDIRNCLHVLAEKENDVEAKKVQGEILITLRGLTTAIEGLQSTYRSTQEVIDKLLKNGIRLPMSLVDPHEEFSIPSQTNGHGRIDKK